MSRRGERLAGWAAVAGVMAIRCWLGAGVARAAAPPPKAESRYSLVSASGVMGRLTVRRAGATVDTDWRVDDNGRGAKLKEHVELGEGGLPRRWEIGGNSNAGAPVEESFSVERGRARWRTLGDAGEADGKEALYLPADPTPWVFALALEVVARAAGGAHAVLPAGRIRMERLREVEIGAGAAREKVTAWALWGGGFTPDVLLARGTELVGKLDPGYVFVEDKHAGEFAALSRLAAELSSGLLRDLSARLAHPVDGPLWITNVRVFDAEAGRLLPTASVVVFGDRIVGLRTEAPPPGAWVIDGGGGTLLPGLFDAHAHLFDWSGPLHLASGVTLARDPGGDNASLLELVPRYDRGELLGPRARLSGFLEGRTPFSAHDGFVIATLEEGLDKVRWYADHGFWGIKIYNSMPPDFVKPLAAEAHRLGLHVSGHVPAFMSVERAVQGGYDQVTHVNQLLLSYLIDPARQDTRTPFRFTALGERAGGLDLGGAPFQGLLKAMKDRGVSHDPTLATFRSLLLARPGRVTPVDAPWIDHAPPQIQRERRHGVLDVKPALYATYDASARKLGEAVRLLHERGIALVPGTDDVPGLMLHSELESWVDAGVPAADALRAATLGGARLLGLTEQLGTVARGKLADLYLVDGDPTTDIRALRRGRLVVKGGVVLYPDEIHEALGVKPFAPRAPLRPPK